MDESIVKHLERQTEQGKLSGLIRRGLGILQKEERVSWMFCALGAAFAGFHGRAMTADEEFKFSINGVPTRAIADAIKMPRALCADVSNMHFTRHLPASNIADWLESIGE